MTTITIPSILKSELLEEDEDLRDIVVEFVEGLEDRLRQIHAAFVALNWDRLAALAHQLKGAGGSYGYPLLSKVAADLEHCSRAQESTAFSTLSENLQSLASAARAGLQEGQF